MIKQLLNSVIAKCRNLLVSRRSIICRSQSAGHWQITIFCSTSSIDCKLLTPFGGYGNRLPYTAGYERLGDLRQLETAKYFEWLVMFIVSPVLTGLIHRLILILNNQSLAKFGNYDKVIPSFTIDVSRKMTKILGRLTSRYDSVFSAARENSALRRRKSRDFPHKESWRFLKLVTFVHLVFQPRLAQQNCDIMHIQRKKNYLVLLGIVRQIWIG